VHSARILLVTVVVVTGSLSAFLVNDAICLVMAPLVIEVARRLDRDPVPYLLAVATASNVGSVATITGNPQNMIIGVASAIPFDTFTAALAPVAAIGLVVVILVVAVVYRDGFRRAESGDTASLKVRLHRGQATKAIIVTLGLIVAFFARIPVSEAAIVAGALLLVTRGVKPQRIYREIDGSLLLMFAGLFVVVAGFERAVITPELVAEAGRLGLNVPWRLALVTAILSNLVSNVPAVLLLKPFVLGMADSAHAWIIVAMGSTLAGNLTLLGSVANLIVAEKAKSEDIEVSFAAYLRVGLPVTILSLAFGTWWLS
jgi:Na+/H+ antiporter NhaD/arsenite permease-like protein